MGIMDLYTAEEAWDELTVRKRVYYGRYQAVYSGVHTELRKTGDKDSFWRRPGKKYHAALAAEIASTSANLLFGEVPQIRLYNDKRTEAVERLEDLIAFNDVYGKLLQGAEFASVYGDVSLKLNWDDRAGSFPTLSVVKATDFIPEYRSGVLVCIHYFTVLKHDTRHDEYWRVYERYQHGSIHMELYLGTYGTLGDKQPDDVLESLGFTPDIETPIPEILAVHIPNLLPNREMESPYMGRSDFEGTRDLMDALDEAYSSWIRDIRLGKSRLIVPAEYLRRRPADMFKEGQFTYEFDEDVETLVALDIDTDKPGAGQIVPSQFQIRTAEHKETCESLTRNIVAMCGYSPQGFGLQENGYAVSSVTQAMRERMSLETRGRKENYWRPALERIFTAMIGLDGELYSNVFGVDSEVEVVMSDGVMNDITTTAQVLNELRSAQAISIEESVRTLHPDWSDDKVQAEVAAIEAENAEPEQ